MPDRRFRRLCMAFRSHCGFSFPSRPALLSHVEIMLVTSFVYQRRGFCVDSVWWFTTQNSKLFVFTAFLGEHRQRAFLLTLFLNGVYITVHERSSLTGTWGGHTDVACRCADDLSQSRPTQSMYPSWKPEKNLNSYVRENEQNKTKQKTKEVHTWTRLREKRSLDISSYAGVVWPLVTLSTYRIESSWIQRLFAVGVPSFPPGSAISQQPMDTGLDRPAPPSCTTSAMCANIFASVGVQQRTRASQEASFFPQWGRMQESLKMWNILLQQLTAKDRRCSGLTWELLCLFELSYSHNYPLRTKRAVGLTMEFVIIAAVKCERVGSWPVAMTDSSILISCSVGWIYSAFIMHLHNPPLTHAVDGQPCCSS